MMLGSFKQIIDSWETLQDFASDIDVLANTAKKMRSRDSISSVYWDDLVRAAHRRGFNEITYEALARLHAKKAGRSSEKPLNG